MIPCKRGFVLSFPVLPSRLCLWLVVRTNRTRQRTRARSTRPVPTWRRHAVRRCSAARQLCSPSTTARWSPARRSTGRGAITWGSLPVRSSGPRPSAPALRPIRPCPAKHGNRDGTIRCATLEAAVCLWRLRAYRGISVRPRPVSSTPKEHAGHASLRPSWARRAGSRWSARRAPRALGTSAWKRWESASLATRAIHALAL